LPLVTPEWSNFFVAELGALAALTGFVVVAISINLSRILSFPSLPGRAAEALIGPVGAMTVTGLALVPGQPPALLGAEVLAIGLVTVLASTAIQVRARGARKDVTAGQRVVRIAASEGVTLAFAVGGALLILGRSAGLYWIAAGDIASLIAIVLSAWVLMVEIMR
jgi:modulator of FtsH protease